MLRNTALIVAVCAFVAACGGGTKSAGPDASAPPAGLDAGVVLSPDSGAVVGLDAGALAGADAGDPRQALRDESLFANGSFEQVNGDQPVSWGCQYFGTGTAPAQLCVVREGDAENGTHYLEIAPGVAAYAKVATPTPPQQVHFDLFARAQAEVDPSDFYLLETSGTTVVRTLYAKTSTPTQGSTWSFFQAYSAPLDGTDGLTIVFNNATGTVPLQVDDFVAVEIPDPIVVPGHLLSAEGVDAISCSAGAAEEVLFLPLPLMHGVQVPLYVDLAIDPPTAATIEYTLDAEGNLGALIHVAAATHFSLATLHMQAVVLTREATTDEMATLYPQVGDPSSWLAATAIVEWQDPGLNAAVQTVVAGLSDPESEMAAILAWTSTYVTNPGTLTSLDALSVFQTKNASCTGFANLGAAAGRASGVPTRSVANYFVGMAQQTHYIDEFWLGSQAGWRLVEPQQPATTVAADYVVAVRANLVEEEGADAMDPNNAWSMPGVPFKSLLRSVQGSGRCWPTSPAVIPFPESPESDHKARYQAGLQDDKAQIVTDFNRARTLWTATLATLQASGPNAAEQQLRAQALSAYDLAAVEALLGQLEAQH